MLQTGLQSESTCFVLVLTDLHSALAKLVRPPPPAAQHYLSMAHSLPRPGGLGRKYRRGRGASVVNYSSHAQGRYVVLRAQGF